MIVHWFFLILSHVESGRILIRCGVPLAQSARNPIRPQSDLLLLVKVKDHSVIYTNPGRGEWVMITLLLPARSLLDDTNTTYPSVWNTYGLVKPSHGR